MSVRSVCSPLAVGAGVALAVAAAACAQSVESGPPGQPGSPDGPDGGETGTGAYLTVPLSSCVPTTYTAAVTIGGSQTFQLTIDTGSTSLGVASAGCTECSGVTPLYDPGTTAVDERRQASSEYETGKWSGEVYQDTVTAGSGTPVPVQLVAIDKQSAFFVPTSCDSDSGSMQGILGLGPSAAAVDGTNGYVDQLVSAGIVSDVLSIWLCDGGGTLWLGGYDPAAVTRPPAYTPQLSDYGGFYYSLRLTSIGIAGTRVELPARYPDSVVDTGSSVFILPRPTFTAVTKAIADSPGYHEVLGGADASWFDDPTDCRPLGRTKAQLDALLPPLALALGDAGDVAVEAPATESYLVPYRDQWCPALYAMDQGRDFPLAAVLGSPVLRSSVVVFDRANRRIGFAPHAPCP